MVQRKQIVIDYVNRKTAPYFISVRVLTLNQKVAISTLRKIAFKEATDFESKFLERGRFKKIIGEEDKEISSREERGLNNQDIFVQIQQGQNIVVFKKVT